MSQHLITLILPALFYFLKKMAAIFERLNKFHKVRFLRPETGYFYRRGIQYS